MAVLPGRGELWVTQMTTTMAHVFRLSDLAHLASFSTGGCWPKVITVSPDEKTAFVSNWESKDISVIDVDSRSVSGRIAVGGIPRGMALSRDGAFLYVCLFDRGTVQKVDLAKRVVAKSLSFGEGALRHIVLHPSGDILYVSDMLRGRILEVDASRDSLRRQLRVDRNLNTIALSPDGRHLFVCSRGPNNPEDYTKKGPAFGTLSCIDTQSMRIIDWAWGRNQPTGLAVSPDGRTVAFSNFLDDEVEVYAFSPDATIGSHRAAARPPRDKGRGHDHRDRRPGLQVHAPEGWGGVLLHHELCLRGRHGQLHRGAGRSGWGLRWRDSPGWLPARLPRSRATAAPCTWRGTWERCWPRAGPGRPWLPLSCTRCGTTTWPRW